ncbi:MAG TPA: hypothetical protein VNR68_09075 [Sphingomicrobium sp.]|nr:hypothetical protein [Sphingomicrobium sp.]
MNRIEKISFVLALAAAADPALAGIIRTPAPVAGVGIGAVVLIGIGYRALKRRINP